MEVLRRRLIALFDILGFSTLLERRGLERVYEDYAALIDRVQDEVFNPPDLFRPGQRQRNFARTDFVFDSLVVVSESLDEKPVRPATNFLNACTSLLQKTFAARMPLRGAIGFGDYLRDDSRSVFLSDTFKALVTWEQEQEWSGCVLVAAGEAVSLRHTYYEPDRAAAANDGSRLIIPWDVPLKRDRCERRWCLNWVYMMDPPDLTAGLDFLKEPKRRNTEAFVSAVHAMPPIEQRLTEPNQGVVGLRYRATRGSAQVKFLDERGCGIDPPPGMGVEITPTYSRAEALGRLLNDILELLRLSGGRMTRWSIVQEAADPALVHAAIDHAIHRRYVVADGPFLILRRKRIR